MYGLVLPFEKWETEVPEEGTNQNVTNGPVWPVLLYSIFSPLRVGTDLQDPQAKLRCPEWSSQRCSYCFPSRRWTIRRKWLATRPQLPPLAQRRIRHPWRPPCHRPQLPKRKPIWT